MFTNDNKVIDALNFATARHAGQFRKHCKEGQCPIPYITHPVRVMLRADTDFGMSIATWEWKQDFYAALLLHDTVEDTATTIEEIYNRFGDFVGHIVNDLTNVSKLPEHANKRRAERKRLDREHIANAWGISKMAKMIDRIDNLYDFIDNGPRDFLVDVYVPESKLLLDVCRTEHNTRVADKLQELLEEIVDGKSFR